jgi:hypothetical protein
MLKNVRRTNSIAPSRNSTSGPPGSPASQSAVESKNVVTAVLIAAIGSAGAGGGVSLMVAVLAVGPGAAVADAAGAGVDGPGTAATTAGASPSAGA